MMPMRSLLFLTALGLIAACETVTLVAPPEFLDKSLESGGLKFTASISKSTIPVGDTATLHFVVRNTGSDTLRLTFGMGCPTLPYIKDAAGDIDYPEGGGWACPAVISKLVLAPGAERDHTVLVRGGAGRTNSVPFTIEGSQ
jgi:hypothetical protein